MSSPALFWDLWSNLFLLFAACLAFYCGETFPGVVVWSAYVVSTIHHGCTEFYEINASLGVSTYLLLALGLLSGAASIIFHLLRRAPNERRVHESQVFAAIVIGGVALIGIVVCGVGVAGSIRGTVDGCLYQYDPDLRQEQQQQLHLNWQLADMVTAIAAAALVALFFFRLDAAVSSSIFWLAALIMLIMYQYKIDGLIVEWYTYVAVIVLLTLVILSWALVRHYKYAEGYAVEEAYTNTEVAIIAVLFVAALTLYFSFNAPGVHGVWHLIGGLGLAAVLGFSCA